MSTDEDPAVTAWRETIENWRKTIDARVQEVAERHLEGCYDAMADIEENPDPTLEDPAFAPFCGCTTCVVREVLTAAWVEVWGSAPARDESTRDLLQREWDR